MGNNPPINPEDVPVMDTGDMAPLFDTEEEADGYSNTEN